MLNIIIKIILLLPLVLTGCDKIKFGSGEKIKPVETYSLKISEPSGLALHNNKLWIVSDRKSSVYITDLEGKEEFSFKVKDADLEGITVIDDSLLAIAKEISREILISDFYGNIISKSKFDTGGSKNSGLEGITYNKSNGHFYILNEKDPVLLIETNKNLNEISRKKFKDIKDLSGISYSQKENCLWLVSDEEKKIFKFSLEGEILLEYKIDVDQAEGIAVDDEKNLLYIVSDKEEKLFVFKIEDKK
jgi:uncharacterized protein YjiK